MQGSSPLDSQKMVVLFKSSVDTSPIIFSDKLIVNLLFALFINSHSYSAEILT